MGKNLKITSCIVLHLMDAIESKSVGFFLSEFTDELAGRETAEGLEPFALIVWRKYLTCRFRIGLIAGTSP
jgi:hypothetical protein